MFKSSYLKILLHNFCFQHLLYISSEVLNQQTRSREERLREKRQLKQQQQQQQLQSNNNNSSSGKAIASSGSPSAAEKADIENRSLATTETSTTQKRKRSLLTKPSQESAKKQKVSNATPNIERIPAPTPTPIPTATATSSVNSVQQQERTTQPAQPEQPQNHVTLPKPVAMPALPQQPVPMPPATPKGETVLIRLSTGQVVLVPKELLKKINPVGVTTLPTPRLPTLPAAPANKFVPVGINPTTRVESVRQPMPQQVMVKQDLPANVSLNEALDILRQKCGSPAGQPQLTQFVAPKPNGFLKAPVDNVGSANGKTFRYVKVQAFQGPPGTQAATQPGTVVSQPVSSLSEQLVRIQQMPIQLAQQQKPLQQQQHQPQHQFPRPQIIVHRTVPVPTMTRVVTQPTLQQSGIYRHFIVPSTSATTSTVTQIRPASALPRFIRPNGTLQASPFLPAGVSPQGPMKICIIQSPRKPDGTPVSPGSATPGIVVMNPPANFRQLNMNEVFKAISAQNAASSSTVMHQNTSLVTANVAPRGQVVVGDVDVSPRIVATEANGLVPSQVS